MVAWLGLAWLGWWLVGVIEPSGLVSAARHQTTQLDLGYCQIRERDPETLPRSYSPTVHKYQNYYVCYEAYHAGSVPDSTPICIPFTPDTLDFSGYGVGRVTEQRIINPPVSISRYPITIHRDSLTDSDGRRISCERLGSFVEVTIACNFIWSPSRALARGPLGDMSHFSRHCFLEVVYWLTLIHRVW